MVVMGFREMKAPHFWATIVKRFIAFHEHYKLLRKLEKGPHTLQVKQLGRGLPDSSYINAEYLLPATI